MKRGAWMSRAIRRSPDAPAGHDVGGRGVWERLRALVPVLGVALVLGIVAAIGAAHVTLRLQELEVGRALSEAHESRSALTTQSRELDAELGTLERADRILPAAREKLQLLPPHPSQLGGPPP